MERALILFFFFFFLLDAIWIRVTSFDSSYYTRLRKETCNEMRPGDDLQVAVGIPSSSSLSWIDRVQLHPTTLKQLGIQSATPAILALQPEDQSEPLIRIANIWPRSTLELGAIHLPAHMQGSKYQIKSVKVYPVKRTSESTLPKATEVKFELLESSRKDAELDEESRQLLQCWAREHLGE